MKSLLTDPKKFRKVNGWLSVFWIAMTFVSWAAGWLTLVEYVSALSIYAIIMGHVSTWQAAKVEERQAEDGRS